MSLLSVRRPAPQPQYRVGCNRLCRRRPGEFGQRGRCLQDLGDSITFGETDLLYRSSLGDRGYVSLFADAPAARNGGVRPEVVNLAIDGETAASFTSDVGRTAPVVGRTDVPLALENLHYSAADLVSQGSLFASTVASEILRGNTVGEVTITLGFNELGAFASLPPAAALTAIPQTLQMYQNKYSAVFTPVRSLLPNTNLFLLGYFVSPAEFI